MDLASITAGVAAAKSGFDTLRVALGLVKDVQGVLPAGEKKDAVGASLAEAEKQLRTAEAQIAQGLGYPLCRCAFPPTPMLEVGECISESTFKRVVVHECPRCWRTDSTRPEGTWTRSVIQSYNRNAGDPPTAGQRRP
jgi:hypothetical protein